MDWDDNPGTSSIPRCVHHYISGKIPHRVSHTWQVSNQIGSMALHAIRGKALTLMIWINGSYVILLVTCEAVRRRIAVITGSMAFGTIYDIMTPA